MHYQRVATEEALLDAINAGATILCGGTDLLVKMRAGLVRPASIVDISELPPLRRIAPTDDNDAVEIGAATPESEILADDDVRRRLPLLAEALSQLGSVQIRNRGSLGGNLVNASPAADSAIPLLLYDAELDLVSPAGARTVPVAGFFVGPGRTILGPSEVVRTVRIPTRTEAYATFYHKVGKRKALTISIASLGALLHVEDGAVVDARFAAGSVAPTPIRLRSVEEALVGRVLDEETIEIAGRLAEDAVSPIDDVRASAAYRRTVIGDLTRRAVRSASR